MQDFVASAFRRSLRLAALLGPLLALVAAMPADAAGALGRIKASGKLNLGYGADMAPYASTDAVGAPAGYAVALCNKVADALKAELKTPSLAVNYVALRRDDALAALTQGKVDLVCGAVPTLERRAVVDFSIPIALGGTSAAVRKDAPLRVLQALEGAPQNTGANWRASQDQAPQRGVIAIIEGSVLAKGLEDRLKQRRINVSVVTVKDAAAGLQLLDKGNTDAFFADRALLLDAVGRSKSSQVRVLDRLYRRELIAFAMPRGDDDLRLVVDRTLSHLFDSDEIDGIYSSYFGAPTPAQKDFFRLVSLPD